MMRMNSIIREQLDIPDILMLSYIHNFHTGVNDFQQFWKYRYCVNPKVVIKKLLDLGYAKIACYETILNHKPVSELKDILRENSLPLSGKKSDLIIRITNKIPHGLLKEYCTPMYFELTQLGETAVNENPNVLYAHRHPEYHFTEQDILNDTEDIRKIAFDRTVSEMKLFVKGNKWGLVRNSTLTLSEISNEMNDYRKTFEFLIMCTYIDLSGISDKYAIEHNMMIPGENNCCVILPFHVKRISQCMDNLYMSVQSFINDCCRVVDSVNLPYSYYTTSQIKEQIINSVLQFRGEDILYNSL